jgi:HEAT repeat protein
MESPMSKDRTNRCALCLAARFALACALLPWLVSSGCQTPVLYPHADSKPSTPPDKQPKTDSKALSSTDPFKPLIDDNWVLAVSQPGDSEPPRYRWRHRILDDLLSGPRDKQPDWQTALESDKQMVRINAAVALARLGEGDPTEILTATVRGADLKLPVRRAAAEALGDVHSKLAIAAVEELLNQYGKFTGEARSRYVPELHAELLHAMSRQPATEKLHSTLAAALKSPAAPVKREALEDLALISKSDRTPLPPLALDLASDGDSQVRIAALKLVVARKHEQAEEKLLRALSDYEITVRTSAIELLGEVGGKDASSKLKKLANDSSELIRVAAIGALYRSGDRDSVDAAAKDQSWRVRRKVARACGKFPDRRSMNLARQLLTDPSLEVQRDVVDMTKDWPTEQAGELLLAAMESSSYQTRKDAATLLADRWPKSAGFPIDAPAPRRAELLAELQTNWAAEFGNLDKSALAAATNTTAGKFSAEQLQEVSRSIDTLANLHAAAGEQNAAIESLARLGTDLPPILDALVAQDSRSLPARVYAEILPRCAPEFEELRRFNEGNQAQRRQSIAALARLTETKVLPGIAVARLEELLATEADPVVWMPAFKVIERDTREAATLIAVTGVNHPAPEIRRRACEYFAAYPDPNRATLLLKLLDDTNISVLHAAIQALSQIPSVERISPVEVLLAHTDHSIRLDAATCLTRWKCSSGPAALERLAADEDPSLRRKTALAISKTDEPQLTGVLVKLLDDQQDVRRAALVALRTLTGSETPPAANGVQPAAFSATTDGGPLDSTLGEQAEQWKQWYRRSEQETGRR